jgi:hypothetical protein
VAVRRREWSQDDEIGRKTTGVASTTAVHSLCPVSLGYDASYKQNLETQTPGFTVKGLIIRVPWPGRAWRQQVVSLTLRVVIS